MLRRILSIIGYLAGAAAILLITALLVAYGQGYAYDFKTGRLIRTGLVIIQSTPTGATVTLQGKKLNKKTNYRQSFEQGRYTFELTRDGYRPWKKVVDVVASEVAFIQYALLLPVKPEVKTLASQPAVVAQNISRDHRHLAYVSSADGGIHTLDLTNSAAKPVKVYSPRAATAELPAEVITDVMWSDDASHLLVTTTAGANTVHYLMTASGGQPVNLTQQYAFNFSGAKFAANNWRQLYWLSPDGLRRVDVEAQSISGVLADKVRQFQVAGDRVLYVQQTELGESLWSIDARGTKQELIAALPESDSYAMAFANYKGIEQLAIVPSKTRVGTLYSDIYGQTPVAKTIARDVSQTLFSPDSHLLTFYDKNRLVTYDLERSLLINKNVTYEVAGTSDLVSMSWYDSFHMLLNERGHLYLTEFDGANTHDLGVLAGVFPAYNSPDLKSIIAFRPGAAATGAAAPVSIDEIIIRP